MEFNLWLAYISVISLLIFSPGPSAILCLNHGVKYGAVKSLPTITGGCVAALFLMSLSAFGLGVLLLASAKTFLLVKLLGAAYLVYLGVGMWREGAKGVSLTPNGTVTQPLSAIANFKTGFLVGISNPKDIIFFAALFPNFISLDHPQALQFMILALTWCIVDFSGMFFYSSVGLKVAPWFESTKNMLRFNRFLGGFFVTAGSLLAISNKKL
jgi:homoserine/homoserine lactone efflux protein